jgi:hypothetical protein
MSTPTRRVEAVVVDGRVCVRLPDGGLDPCLTPSEVNTLFGVSANRASVWADRFGPMADLPAERTYPSHVEGGHVEVNGKRLVRRSAVLAWYATTFGDRSPSAGGRPARVVRQRGGAS